MRSQNLASRVHSSGAPFFLFLLCLLAAFARMTTAAPVAIQDASFDTRGLPDGGMSTTLTPWLETGGTGNANGWIERFSGFAADGQNHLAMNLNHNVWQDLGVTYQANTRYTLTVAVGNRSTFTQAANQSRYILAASDGTVFATGTLNASTIPVGTFADAPALVFETGSNPSAIGKTIRVRLEARGFGRSHFDKVRLTAASLLPPLATTLAATEVTDTSAILNGTVNSRELATTVVFEYGLTNSYGSTVPAVPLSLSDDTAVTATLDGLPPGTTYHYRVVATNEKGTTQGADLTFTTAIPAYLSGLTSSEGALAPAFSETVTSYVLQVPSATAAVRLTPATGSAGATIRVQGVEVASGTASALIPVSPGHSVITVGVTAAGSSLPKNYQLLVIRPPSPFVFTSPDVPAFEAPAFYPTGSSADFSLGFAPVPGTNLTVVRNTGQSLIQGNFNNLTHGQVVNLTYGGISYPFVANYFGGTGNDLVLQWGNMRLLTWGANGTLSSSSVPVAVDMTGVLAVKVPLNVSAGHSHCLALCADGTVVAWGNNYSGQLGNSNTTSSRVPVAVRQTGALAGKTVIAVKAGVNHSLALCSDGTLVAWGNNSSGQLGNGGTSSSTEPVAVDQSGVLAGKTIIELAAGYYYSLVLCSDGTLAAWGSNSGGSLGNGSATNTNSSVPVLVSRTGVLAGKTVTGISAPGSSDTGGNLSLAVCSDGTVAGWGHNGNGQLGNGSTTNSNVPVAVTHSGVLSGKTVVAAAAEIYSSVVLCSNGIMAAWGNNFSGQLGNSSNTNSSVPVLVTQSGVLSGKTVAAIAGGEAHTLALCSDGTLAAWGYNAYGQLGNTTTTNSNAPVLVNTSVLSAGERVMAITGGSTFSLALTALPPPPMATTLAASGVSDTGATLNGNVAANGNATTVSFEYGLTTSYGTTVAASPDILTGVATTAVSANLTGLLPGTTYHYCLVATSAGGTVRGADMTFTTSSFAALAALAADQGSLWPAFTSATKSYEVVVPYADQTIRFTPAAADPSATVRVNGAVVAAGAASTPIALSVGSQTVSITVNAADGLNSHTYTVTVIRRPEFFTFNAATDIPLTLGGLNASGSAVQFALNFAPPAGTDLTVVKITGLPPIEGTFANLAQGQVVKLAYNGVVYAFHANYFGGNGNDLVLQWANTRLSSWGTNSAGQLGNNTTTDSNVPVAVDASGVLSGKSVIAMSTGGDSSFNYGQSLVLCADGTLAAWGTNTYGQLGNNTTTTSKVPVAVDRGGVLADKIAVAAATGMHHHLVLCADGTLVAWGRNDSGQLGVGTTSNRSVPVAVSTTGVLAGKRVAAIAAGGNFSMALCSDGSLATWGGNNDGQLGIGATTQSNLPVLVDRSGVLAGKQIIVISAGAYHALALCSDGSIAAWGNGTTGQLGTGIYTSSRVPVLVNRAGALAGKTVVEIACGGWFGMARCADGTLAAWGRNYNQELGNNVGPYEIYYLGPLPVPVLTTTGALAGKFISRCFPGETHNLAIASDGTLAAWGNAYNGRLGHGSSSSSTSTAVLVKTGLLKTGERFMAAASGPLSSHNLALIATPPAPDGSTLAATAINDTGATLNGSVRPNNNTASVFFEYGLTTSYGTKVAATPATASGTAPTAASLPVTGLKPGTLYHYRLLVTSANGTSYGENVTFTTSALATLAGLSLDHGILAPGFDPVRTRYITTVPYGVANVAVTPLANHPEATVRVNGSVVESGIPGAPLPLSVGTNAVTVVVNSGDGENVMTYEIAVTRMAERYEWTSADVVQMEGDGFLATGDAPPLALGFAPQAGANLMLVNNTSDKPISGNFGNLTQGQALSLEFAGNHYSFIANYSGGTGNDLTLEWGNTRIMTWGLNTQGQLGDGTLNNSLLPTPVPWPGALAGKHLVDVKAGFQHSLALHSDGSLSIWGNTKWNSSSGSPSIPAVVPVSGALQGRTVVRIAAGEYHNLALCSDGTLVAWGNNYHGQLGNNGSATSNTPVAVDQTGALAGKQIVDIAAGKGFSFALCSDGTVAGWGWLYGEELSPQLFRTPARIDMPGGRKVVKLAAGYLNFLALCDDGSLICWGANSSGQFGNGTKSSGSSRNLAGVNMTGVLSGKTVREMAVSSGSMLILCSDGTLVSWGNNYYGQLGTGNKTDSLQPVEVNRVGALAGKTVVRVFSGQSQHYAQFGDGTLAAWGHNFYGSLGNGTVADSTLPVEVGRGNFAEGERFLTTLGPGSAYNHALVLTALALPDAMTLAANEITGVSATLHGIFNTNGNQVAVAFEYGLDSGFGSRVEAVPGKNGGTEVFAELSELKPGTTYHFRILAESGGGMVRGPAMTFTTLSDNAKLAGLTNSAGFPVPAFEKLKFDYLISVANSTDQISITPVTDHTGAKVKIGGQVVVSGTASEPLPLEVGNNTLTVFVTAEDGITTLTYTLVVTRMPAVLAMEASGVPPVTAEGFFANDLQAMLRLNFHPSFGSNLMVVNNTSLAFIHGRFSNLAHGQRVWLTYEGVSYAFVADYYGGTGNDLVLQWAGTRVAAWGLNNYGQLGDGGNTQRLAPVAVDDTGVLADKTIFAISTGYLHSLALCSDGMLASWGYNVQGQLGDNGSAHQKVPVAVDASGVLSDKVVVAVASGSYHNLALCADGTIAAWGFNNHGQLGDGTKTTARTPVLVMTDGVLAGKQVVAVAAGAYQSYALCSDGTLAAWGYNDEGELGDGGNTGSLVPVAVDMSGVLASRKVSNIAAGQYHALALCTDGTLVSWGYNPRGQLGNSSTADGKSPVAIGSSGALAGKSVKAIAAGASHSLALCTDGTLAAWGFNSQSQLGATGISQSTTPVAVAPPARPLATMATGAHHNLLRFTDGGMAAWGGNSNGQLGDNNIQTGATVVKVDTGSLDHGGFIMFAASGCASSHNLAVFAVPVDPPAGLEAWRLENFADMGIDSPLAGDCADCDGDGIPNLAEYAFGLDPHQNSADKMPRPKRVGNRFELRFSREQTSPNIEYGVEWSPDLRPGSWRDVPDSGNDSEHVFSLPMETAPQLFMRHRVRVLDNAVPE